MTYDSRRERFEKQAQEVIFHQRLAALRAKNQQFPWSSAGEMPELEIPREESKLMADREIEGQEITDAELERRAMLDLTSLSFNFKTFYKRLHYEIRRARRYDRDLAVLLVAVDRLDEFGAHLGLDGKTAVIEGAARSLLSSIRDVDIAGRCREDCFGVILPETGKAGALVAAERIRTRIEQNPVAHGYRPINLTISLGASCCPEDSDEVEELLAQAIEALTHVVNRGGNGISFNS